MFYHHAEGAIMPVKNVFAHPLEMRDGRRIALHAPSETCDESALRNIKTGDEIRVNSSVRKFI